MKLIQQIFDFFANDEKKPCEVPLPPDASALPSFSPNKPFPRSGNRDAELEKLCREKLAAVGCAELSVKVFWNNRLKTTAGVADWRKRTITLNTSLKKISSQEIERTLLHELAHLLAQYRVGEKRIYPHGTAWHKACRDLGIPNETRCHTLPFEQKRLPRPYEYSCPHCGDTFTRTRPMRYAAACHACCLKYNRGRYDKRFHLVVKKNHTFPDSSS